MGEFLDVVNNCDSATVDEFFFRNFGKQVEFNELGEFVADADELGVLTELANLLDAGITVYGKRLSE